MGFAPDSWDSLTKSLTAHGFNEKQIVSAGLALERKNGDGIYDRLRDRVIIPISDISGKAVAFGGRILVADENQPKYLNTPETEIFSKGKLLFGLDKSNRAIISANTAIVVEGYMDAISPLWRHWGRLLPKIMQRFCQGMHGELFFVTTAMRQDNVPQYAPFR